MLQHFWATDAFADHNRARNINPMHLNTDSAISRPIVLTSPMDGSPRRVFTATTVWHFDAANWAASTAPNCEELSVSECLPSYPRKADIAQYGRHVSKVPSNGSSFSLDHLVGKRERHRRYREAERRSLGRVLRGSLRGWSADSSVSRAKNASQKNLFRPMGWGKLAISFWCDGLVRERLDRRRTANVAADGPRP